MNAFETKRAKFEQKFNAAKDLADYPIVPLQAQAGSYTFVKSDGDRYTCKVVQSKAGTERVECDCKGFTFNAYCKHSTHVRFLRGDVTLPSQAVLPLLGNA
jgi:hypothetical protein